MDCAEARRILWPPERLRAVDEEVSRAQLHVRECACCQSYLRQDEALLDLYARVRGIRAPRSVRRRVFDTLTAARLAGVSRSEGGSTPPRERLRRLGALPVVPVATLVTLVALLAAELYAPLVDGEPSAVFVEDYLRRAVGQERIESGDPMEIRRFLERELGLRVAPLSVEGFALVRAEICLLEGRRGAMIVYRGAGGDVSHYVIPKNDTADRPPVVSTRAGGPTMPVVTWAVDEVEHALVGEIEADVLLDLAEQSLRRGLRHSRGPMVVPRGLR